MSPPIDFSEYVKSSHFWLPKNVSWFDIHNRPDFHYPDVWILVNKLIPTIAVIFIVRHLMIRELFLKLGLRMNISGSRAKKPPFCQKLEDVYCEKGSAVSTAPGQLKRLSEVTGLSQQQVYNWLKIRRLHDEIPDLDKFTEDCWMAFYCTGLSTLGALALYNDPAVFDINQMWDEYPFQNTGAIYEWFYVFGMTLFVVDGVMLSIKKHETADLILRLYHHSVSFLLLTTSWLTNEVRLGSIVLFMLESCSPFLYSGKVAEWLRCPKTSVVLLAIAFAHWCFIRTAWFHLVFLPGVFVYRHIKLGLIPAYVIIDVFLAQLLVINFCWVKMVFSKVYRALFKGQYFKVQLNDKTWGDLAEALRLHDKAHQNRAVRKLLC